MVKNTREGDGQPVSVPVLIQRTHGARAIVLAPVERVILNILFEATQTDTGRQNPFIFSTLFAITNRELEKIKVPQVSKSTFSRRIKNLGELHLLRHFTHTEYLDLYDDEQYMEQLSSLLFAHKLIEARYRQIENGPQVERFKAQAARIKDKYEGRSFFKRDKKYEGIFAKREIVVSEVEAKV